MKADPKVVGRSREQPTTPAKTPTTTSRGTTRGCIGDLDASFESESQLLLSSGMLTRHHPHPHRHNDMVDIAHAHAHAHAHDNDNDNDTSNNNSNTITTNRISIPTVETQHRLDIVDDDL